MLNLLHEILIFLEDSEKPVPFRVLKKFGTRKVGGVLGRMEARGLIEKHSQNGQIFYSISPEGREFLNQHLELIHSQPKWEGSWYLFAFSIPEKQRHIRDKLRRHLKKLGLGLLFNNLWLTPFDKTKELTELVKKMKIEERAAWFEVSPTKLIAKKLIQEAWNLKKLETDYRRFIQQVKKALPKLTTAPDKRFRIKKLIFSYALILAEDPNLPPEYLPANWPRAQAHQLYRKIRELLFK